MQSYKHVPIAPTEDLLEFKKKHNLADHFGIFYKWTLLSYNYMGIQRLRILVREAKKSNLGDIDDVNIQIGH